MPPVLQDQAASLANELSKQEASAARVQKLMQQLSVVEANLRERTEALASANYEIRNLQQVCAPPVVPSIFSRPSFQLRCSPVWCVP